MRESARFTDRLAVEAGLDKVSNVNEEITLAAAFSDPWGLHRHTATIDWGDGSPLVSGTVDELTGKGKVSGSHTYRWSGPYDVTVTVTDNLGHTGVDSFAVTVAGPWAFEDFDDGSAGGSAFGDTDLLQDGSFGLGTMKSRTRFDDFDVRSADQIFQQLGRA